MVDFPGYKGPPWFPSKPTWIPIPLNDGRCSKNCCSRSGFPLIPGYAIPIAKSQGLTIGVGNPVTHCRVKLQSTTKMESLNLGLTYVALSRVQTETDMALVEPIPQDRLLYINNHPHMKGRIEEDQRLLKLSEETVSQYLPYADDIEAYLNLLREMDDLCEDGITDSVCDNISDNCKCVICHCENLS